MRFFWRHHALEKKRKRDSRTFVFDYNTFGRTLITGIKKKGSESDLIQNKKTESRVGTQRSCSMNLFTRNIFHPYEMWFKKQD